MVLIVKSLLHKCFGKLKKYICICTYYFFIHTHVIIKNEKAKILSEFGATYLKTRCVNDCQFKLIIVNILNIVFTSIFCGSSAHTKHRQMSFFFFFFKRSRNIGTGFLIYEMYMLSLILILHEVHKLFLSLVFITHESLEMVFIKRILSMVHLL